MVARVLALVGFLCLYGVPAFANGGGQGCTELRHVHGWVSVQSFLGRALIPDHIYEGEEAAAITARFNALPPRTEIEADTIIAFEVRGAPIVLFFFAKGDCLTRLAQLPATEWDKIVNGDPA